MFSQPQSLFFASIESDDLKFSSTKDDFGYCEAADCLLFNSPLNFPSPWLMSIFLLCRTHLWQVPVLIFHQIWTGLEEKKEKDCEHFLTTCWEVKFATWVFCLHAYITYLTVAATWKTMLTCLIRRARSLASIPRPADWQSPLMAMTLWRNFGLSRLTRSKS